MPGLSTVQVRVRPINPTDNNSNVLPPENDDLTGIYIDYVITNRYEKDGQLFMLGNSVDGGNADAVSFVQIANPTVLWIVDWTASRYKYKPLIPDPTLRPNLRPFWKLIDEHLETGAIELCSDNQTPKFRISGTYFYGLKKPLSKLSPSTRFPRLPWLTDFANRDVPDNMFEQTISS